MMDLLRNPEVEKDIKSYVVASIVLLVIAFYLDSLTGMVVVASCIVFFIIYLQSVKRRYQKIKYLNEEIDKLLLQGKTMDIREYQEGELSILAHKIQKITLQLTESQERLKSDKKLLADSLANISHQIRTPLTSLNLITELLSGSNLTNERKEELVNEMRVLLGRMEWLIEMLLKLSRFDAGVVQMNKQLCSLEQIVRQAMEQLEIPFELKNIQLIKKYKDIQLEIDSSWMTEAMANILKNALEHTPEGGNVYIHADETALYKEIEIEDTGAGFNQKDLSHLFERFYKGEGFQDVGYGIGLSMAKNIILENGGSIQAKNGKLGAKFIIRFDKVII
ncbi:hypothetical protein P261_00558 [Lachnospiraceae bacterium TWA4]|nr:hypothetical protein P261_00558 [Lachnospiraceae bacterium TWA4]